jgi:leucyl-tRNA synthetase
VKDFSSDAMRWALADAGDGMDDANFETTTANAAILRLTKELTWIEEVLGPAGGEEGECGCFSRRRASKVPLDRLNNVVDMGKRHNITTCGGDLDDP